MLGEERVAQCHAVGRLQPVGRRATMAELNATNSGCEDE